MLFRGIKIWTDLSSVLSQSTRLTDGWTDRILIARLRLHSMLLGKNGFFVNKKRHVRVSHLLMSFYG